MVLRIETYNQREAEARVRASYPALRAFSPSGFNEAGFPSRITDEAELMRYADIMYETRSRTEWLTTKRYSPPEAAMMQQLSIQIENLTRRLFQKPVQPLMCLFAPIDLMRIVTHLAASVARPLTVMEIGPGSGHLSAYLLNAGHRVIAVDICQSLYLWQNRLFGDYALDEWASEEIAAFPRRSSNAQIVHIPWWHFARFHEGIPVAADIVICDAALGEMEHFGFRYVVEVAKNITKQSPIGCFLYQNLGEERFQTRLFAEQYAATRGFRLQHVGGVSVLIGSDEFPMDAIAGLSEPPAIGKEALGNPAVMRSPQEFRSIDATKRLESYAFFDFIGLGQ